MRFLLWLVLMLAGALSGWHLGWTPPADNHPATVQTVSPQISILGDRRPSLARLRQRLQQDQLAPDTLPRRVLAALERSKTDGSFEVQALLAQWFQEDREGLRKWLVAEWRPQAIYRSVARLWVREDLEKAWLERDHPRWHSALFEAIVDLNPQAIFTGPHPPSHLPRPSPDHIRDAAIRWAEKDFNAAAEAVQKGSLEGAVGLAQVKYRQASFSDALRWADSFEPHRETALCAVIDQLAKEDLEKAMRHLSEHGVTDTSYLAVSNFRRALADRSAEDVVDLLRRYPVSIPSLYTTLNDLPADPRELEKLLEPIADRLVDASSRALSIWTPSVEEVDIVGTLDGLADDPGNALRQSILRRSLETWRGDHTHLVLDWIASREDAAERTRYELPSTDTRDRLAKILADAILTEKPDKASNARFWQWWQALPPDLQQETLPSLDRSYRGYEVYADGEHLQPPLEGRAHLARLAMEDTDVVPAFMQYFGAEWAGENAREALAWVLQRYEGRELTGAYSWPMAGSMWTISGGEEARAYYRAVSVPVLALARQDPWQAVEALEEVPFLQTRGRLAQDLAAEWARTEPHAALAWSQTLPAEDVRRGAQRQAMVSWAKQDPDSASSFSLRADSLKERQVLISHVGDAVRQGGSAVDGAQWLVSLPDELVRSELSRFISQPPNAERVDAFKQALAKVPPDAGKQFILELIDQRLHEAEP